MRVLVVNVSEAVTLFKNVYIYTLNKRFVV